MPRPGLPHSVTPNDSVRSPLACRGSALRSPGPGTRARRAIEDSGNADAGGSLIDLLVEEADARARAGDPSVARGLLDDAARRAAALGDAERLGQVALGVQRLGARFAMPRDAVVELLEGARNDRKSVV